MEAAARAPKKFFLFKSGSVSLDKVIRKVTLAFGLRKEEAGEWRRIYDTSTSELRGFQLIAPEDARVDIDLPSIRSTAAIAPWEMDLNLGLSHTGAMDINALERDVRIASGRLPEDAVERVQAKVRVYPLIGAARGDILRVWPVGARA